MILNPQQIKLMRMGLPDTPLNRSSDSSSSSSTTNQYADKRNAVQGGVGVSGDGNVVFNSSNTTDYGAIGGALQGMMAALGLANSQATFANQTGQAGIFSGMQTAQTALTTGAQTAQYATGVIGNVAQGAISDVTGASNHLNDVGLSMLQSNTALTNSLANGSNNLVTHVLDVAGGLYRDAAANQTQTVGIAADLAKTQVAAQNDNRYLIAAGLAVIGIVGVMAFKGKA